jgi:uncharacterized protein YeaO (DUF488 family)/uncharacterized protein with GYD domain
VVTTRRIYDPPREGEGPRLLIMRLWPRGIRKEKVDRWLRELGPVLPLLKAFRAGRVDWDEYRHRYHAGLERPEAQAQVEEALGLARSGGITLLCGCPDESRCHRTLLRDYLLQRRTAAHIEPGRTAMAPTKRTTTMRAYVLIESAAGKTKGVKTRLAKLGDGGGSVVHLDAVTGPYDFIAVVEGPNIDAIGRLVTDGIGAIDGVTRTTTCIAVAIG